MVILKLRLVLLLKDCNFPTEDFTENVLKCLPTHSLDVSCLLPFDSDSYLTQLSSIPEGSV